MADIRNGALETLFTPFDAALAPAGRALFLGARAHPVLGRFDRAWLVLQQYFKPYESALRAGGYDVQPDIPLETGAFDLVLLLAPKNQIETLYMMARGLVALKDGGRLVVAADNKAGAERLAKNFAQFGLAQAHSESRNKARVVWAERIAIDVPALEKALAAGAAQDVCDGAFRSIPGVYGWNKTDKGSVLLAQRIPDTLSGNGADFGCGYGYLARHVLQHCEGVKALHCHDADWRAVQLCRENISSVKSDAFLDYGWEDLTQTPQLKNLSFIVMNPPFHEGKTSDTTIGAEFVTSAAASLKRGGVLWMVANKQLPYENILQQNFWDVKKPCEEQGFKIFCATK